MLESIVAAVVSALLSFPVGMLFERRKRAAEADGTELENVEKGLELYRKMLADAREMIDILERRVTSLEREVARLRMENQELKTKR